MWKSIGTAPVNTYVLARMTEPGRLYVPAVALFDTGSNKWIGSDDMVMEGWKPTEWHPLPPENEALDIND